MVITKRLIGVGTGLFKVGGNCADGKLRTEGRELSKFVHQDEDEEMEDHCVDEDE